MPYGILIMTSTDASFRRLIIDRPFAYGASAPKTTIGIDSNSPMSTQDGFSASYTSAISSGGRYVTRGDMNALGNLASQSQFYFQAGGLNTFDQEFCIKIGGYPKDAVLDLLVGTRLYKVVSLKDNNKVDFTGNRPQYQGIQEGRVDNVYWAYANMDAPISNRVEACSIPKQIVNDGVGIINLYSSS